MQTASPITTPAAIRTAQAVLAGKLPLAECLGISIEHQSREGDPPGLDLIFCPKNMFTYFNENPGQLVPDLDLTGLEVQAVNNGDVELSARVYDQAAKEALKTLVELAEKEDTTPSPRLLHRLCMAVREELSALVAEWTALEAKGVA